MVILFAPMRLLSAERKTAGPDRARHYGSPGEEATRERDQFINVALAEAWTAPDRVKRAATARYDAKVTAAQTKYDKDCGNAEAELARMLDQRRWSGRAQISPARHFPTAGRSPAFEISNGAVATAAASELERLGRRPRENIGLAVECRAQTADALVL
jgi:hypothetical protein